ncbi:MAG: OmpA family protein [Mariprofundaceae bacterium]|nr:OmpA family protein [Mariprofundaceae bacterium]
MHIQTITKTQIVSLLLLILAITGCQTNTKKTDSVMQDAHKSDLQASLLKIEKIKLIAENNRLLAQEANLKELNRTLKNEVQEKTVMVEQLKNQSIKVTMLNSILFSSGQYKLNKQGRLAIAKLVNVIKKHIQQGGIVRIIGHTDNLYVNKRNGVFQDNWDLSSLRAASVVRLLVWGHHIAPNAFRVEGHADTEPKASNATKTGRAQNRRIEILLSSQ